jgi:hypothetical protein
VLLRGSAAVRLSDPVLGIAVRLRVGRKKVPFLLRVPLVEPDELEPQRPPRYLPLLRTTWPRTLLFYVALTAVSAWWMHELAVIIPAFVAGALYLQIRTKDALPERLYRFRFALDAVVAVALFLVLWWVAPILAVPCAVAMLVYFVLFRLMRNRRELRIVAALVAGSAWFFLLGTYTGPLSPCRLADGPPAEAADGFAHALLTRDFRRGGTSRSFVEQAVIAGILPNLTDEQADVAVAGRVSVSDEPLCSVFKDNEGVVGCYRYRTRVGKRTRSYLAAVSCGGTSWRLEEWI